jgi:hypothetical protein
MDRGRNVQTAFFPSLPLSIHPLYVWGEGWTAGWMDEYIEGRRDTGKDEHRRGGHREGWSEGRMDRGRNRESAVWTSLPLSFPLHVWKEGRAEGRLERGRDGQRDVWIEGGMDRGWLDRGGMGIEWFGQWEGWTEVRGMDRGRDGQSEGLIVGRMDRGRDAHNALCPFFPLSLPPYLCSFLPLPIPSNILLLWRPSWPPSSIVIFLHYFQYNKSIH